MRCENCGTNLPEDAAFCAECGERQPTHSAAEMVDIAHTSGLVRGRAAGEVPDPAGAPDLPDSVPEIPKAAPLPAARGGGDDGGESALEAAVLSSVDRARIREEARRAAQALVESAQIELQEELAEAAEDRWLAADLDYELEQIYPTDEPPPPPSAEERMWAETRERARLHGTEVPFGEEEDTTPESQKGDRSLGETLESDAEDGGGQCCGYGCLALFVVLFLLFLLGYILNVVQ